SYLGTFALAAVNQAGDSVGWSFEVADGVLDSLQAGQTLTQKYDVTVDDGHGGTAVQTVTITITGTNDVPVITSAVQSGAVTEIADNAAGENATTHAQNGAVTFGDVDALDTHSAGFTAQGPSYLGTFALAAVNQASDSVGWTFQVADSVLDSLNPGETLTQKYDVTVDDGYGGTATQTVTITINGADDGVSVNGLGGVGAEETVYERNLSDGSSPDAAALTQTGSFSVTTADGLAGLTVNGTAVVTAGVFTANQTVDTALGLLTITGYTPTTVNGVVTGATFTYSYLLQDNSTGHTSAGTDGGVFDNFTVAVTDEDGSASSAVLNVEMIDDVPAVVADLDSMAASDFTAATGNVITGAGTTNAGADTLGADGAAVVGVVAGNSGAFLDSPLTLNTQIDGLHGKLTLDANGGYTYVRNPGSAGGVSDVFTYTLKDGDGDLAHTTLTISIGDAGPTVSIPGAGSAGTVVYEKGLPSRGFESAGTGEAADGLGSNNSDTSEKTNGTIGFTSKDGVSTITVGGHTLTMSPTTFIDATGSLTAHYTYNAITGAGTIVYAYTLLDNTSGDNTSVNLPVVISDADGDAAPAGNLLISIVDDAPVLGQFMSAIIPNQAGSVTGTFALQPGADAIANFNIAGLTAVPGLTYQPLSTTTVNGLTTTRLTATAPDPDGAGPQQAPTVFTLDVRSDGTYAFNLVSPNAGTSTSYSTQNLDAGGPSGWRQTSDGRIEFSSPGGVNSNNNGFGVGNTFVGANESFTMEFHNPGAAGDQLPGTNPEFVDAVTLVANSVNGGGTYNWVATNTQTGETASGSVSITSAGGFLIDPVISFNLLQVTGSAGVNNQGAQFSSTTITKNVLPQDQHLDFTISAVDGDGDVTSSSPLSIDVEASNGAGNFPSLTGGAGNDTIAGSAKLDTINGAGGKDIADYSDSSAAVFVNLDENGNASSVATAGNRPEGSIGGGDAAGDTLTSIEGLIGGSGNDFLHGNSAANYLAGGIGNDTLYGEGGADSLYGGLGNDTLYGGTGSDTMTGSGGSDTFVIGSDSLLPGIDDVITDYNYGEGDTVDLSDLLGNLPSGTNLDGNFVQVVQDGQNANLQVDTDGSAGNASGWHTVAVLEDFQVSTEVVKVLFNENGAPKTQDVP
ncbi:type I secretion C-terminal target domain-containing protein, partial [Ensifer sp. T173]